MCRFKRRTFAEPVVTKIAPVNGPTKSGASVSISGINFGTVDPSPTVHLLTTVCATPTWKTDSGIVCKSGDGLKDAATAASVTVSGLIGVLPGVVFSYDGEVLSTSLFEGNPMCFAQNLLSL